MTDPRREVEAVERAIAKCSAMAGPLLPILHAIQDELGFVPASAIVRVAEALNISHAEVHGTITFYHDFRSEPAGRTTVRVCRAEACQALGAERLVAHLQAPATTL